MNYVRITSPVTTPNGAEEREIPFIIAILADLSGEPASPPPLLRDRPFVNLAAHDSGSAMTQIGPRLAVRTRGDSPAQGEQRTLHFASIGDFTPEGVTRQIAGDPEEIIQLPEFQALEATWRGVDYLSGFVAPPAIQVKLLDVSKTALRRDLVRAAHFTQSGIFKLLHDDVYGGAADPFGAVIAAYEFGSQPADLEMLRALSNIGAAIHAPFLAAASPDLVGCDQFSTLERMSRSQVLNTVSNMTHIAWRSFQKTPEARHIILTLPHVLLRNAYGEQEPPLYGNAAFALAACMMRSVARHRCRHMIRGLESGGVVPGLPATGPVCVDANLSDIIEPTLVNEGIACLLGTRNGPPVFFAVPVCHKPDSASRYASAQHLLLAWQFAQHLKRLSYAQRNASLKQEAHGALLQTWINHYVQAEVSSYAEKAWFPLRSATIEAHDGRAIVTLRIDAPGAEDQCSPLSLEVIWPPHI